jgi:acetylornithine/succinyldiaminopimelate/putrescine aminotransferase
VTRPEYGDVLGHGDHGSTFAGAPVTAAAALAALDVLSEPALLASVRELGDQLMDGLAALGDVVEVRGRGLMVGVTLAEGQDAATVARGCLERGVVINVPAPGMLRFLPPLIIQAEDVGRALEIVDASLA